MTIDVKIKFSEDKSPTKAWCVLVQLTLRYGSKLREWWLMFRASQINFLTSPYYVARYQKYLSKKPSKPDIADILNEVVKWSDLIEVVDAKTKRIIHHKLAKKMKLREALYRAELISYNALKTSR